MAINFKTPERCLLAQAALYVDCGCIPIPDEIYLSAPDHFASGPNDLTRALRSNSLTARSDLFEGFRDLGDLTILKDWKPVSSKPVMKDVEINPKLWIHSQIDFPASRLVSENHLVPRFYPVSPAFIELPEFIGDPYDRVLGSEYEAGFLFDRITVATTDLFRVFPRHLHSTHASEKKSRAGSGRPAKYPWNEFFAEIVVRADLDGLPKTQAELVDQMAMWCIENWSEQPSESVLKEKTVDIFNHPRKSSYSAS